MRSALTFALAALLASNLNGQAPPWPFTETIEILKQGQQAAALAALSHLRENRARAVADSKFGAMYFDLLATTSSFVGDHRAALEAESEYFERAEPRMNTSADFAGYHAVPAVGAIVEASKDRRLVMLNEEHRLSLQRSFLADVIPELHAQGFTHLAMEALGEDAARLQARGYAVVETGLYTKDPQLAEAIRLAIGLGMQVVKYEPADVGPEPGDRDRQSAAVLADLLRHDSKARILVYAGRYHIAKKGDSTWTPLAARVREMTGMDPLCVDLIAMRECQRPKDELPAYRAALASGLVGDVPVVLLDSNDRRYSHWPEQIDFTVCFPRTTEIEGRPRWLIHGGRCHEVSIADQVPQSEGVLLARADRPGELPSAIPADQFAFAPGKPSPHLFLPRGVYTVRILTQDNKTLATFDVSVKP